MAADWLMKKYKNAQRGLAVITNNNSSWVLGHGTQTDVSEHSVTGKINLWICPDAVVHGCMYKCRTYIHTYSAVLTERAQWRRVCLRVAVP